MKNLFLLGILLGSMSLIRNVQAMSESEFPEEKLVESITILQLSPSKIRQESAEKKNIRQCSPTMGSLLKSMKGFEKKEESKTPRKETKK